MNYASTFLSHNSKDKPLVELVARELGRRGVVAWLDVDELDTELGGDLDVALGEAVRRQATLTLFLSENSLHAPWVKDELEAALRQQQDAGADIFPVYMGDAEKLVSEHERLKTRWRHPDGRVKILGEVVEPGSANTEDAARIAAKIAKRLYKKLGFASRHEAVICLDQRGEAGRRSEMPHLPENLRHLDAPALIFRSDRGSRQANETLSGEALAEFLRTVKQSLGEAFGVVRESKNIHLCGEAQLALPYLVGKHFDRSTLANLLCYNSKNSTTFDNAGQDRQKPLATGNAYCETELPPDVTKVSPDEKVESAALVLAADKRYVADVLRYLAASTPPQQEVRRTIWIQSGWFTNSAEAMNYAADVVALLSRLKEQNGLKTAQLFLGLPYGVVPLLAANLLFAADKIELMEFRKDLSGKGAPPEELYFPVAMP